MVPAACFSLCLMGCGSGPKENPVSIGVTNPDPNDPLYGVTLENEAQNLARIKDGNGIKATKQR